MIQRLIVLFLLITSTACSQENSYNVDGKGVMIHGYDPVAYFEGNALKGDKAFSYQTEGVIYYFISLSHKNTFMHDPEKYMPQYGGWCAYAMGLDGSKVTIDPQTFKVTDGKLYLFYNKFLTNTLNDWNKDEARLKNQADKNWKKVK